MRPQLGSSTIISLSCSLSIWNLEPKDIPAEGQRRKHDSVEIRWWISRLPKSSPESPLKSAISLLLSLDNSSKT